jgi:hypothetical protein
VPVVKQEFITLHALVAQISTINAEYTTGFEKREPAE